MKYLSQRDKAWANKLIGNTNLTMGRWGCTVVCLSMLSSYYGCYKSPAELASIKTLFDANGKVIWEQVPQVFQGKIKFQVRKVGFDRKAITASVNGSPVTSTLIEVANKSHWVVVTGTYKNDFYCVDPIDAQKKLVLNNFGNITGSSHLTQ